MPDTGTNVGLDFTYLAGGAMTQYTFVKHSTAADRTVLLADSATAPVIGVCQDDATSAQRTQIRTGGRTTIVYGGTVTRGDLLTSDSTGRAITYTKATVFTGTPYIVSGSPVYAVAEESGVVSERHMVLLSPRGLTS
jgi:hypothetical protein